MKRYLFSAILSIVSICAFSQEKIPVYCDICVYSGPNLLNKYSTISFDFGGKCHVDLLDSNNQEIKFYSYIDAINYLSKFGWKLSQTYTVKVFVPAMPTEFEWSDVVHCIMIKSVNSEEEKMDGLKVASISNKDEENKNNESDGNKKKKIVLSKRRNSKQ